MKYVEIWKKIYLKYILSDSDIENGGFRDLLGSEKVREC